MNNTTVAKIEIKLRGDNVYDIYVNRLWVGKVGNYIKALDFVRDYIENDLK